MRNAFSVACVVATALLLTGCGAGRGDVTRGRPQIPNLHRAEVEALISPLVRDEWLPGGVAVGLVTARGVETYGFGGATVRGRGFASHELLFEIGSVTKVFGALLLAVLAEEGVVRLDQPLADLVPEARGLAVAGRPITLAHLATHTSGLPRMPTNFRPAAPLDPYADYDEAALLAYLKEGEPGRAPGEAYEYSNLGAGLLGYALARAADRSWPDLLREKVIAPLGLRDTGVLPPRAEETRLVQGHRSGAAPVPRWTMGALAPAGCLVSSVRDMLRFVEANLSPRGTPIAAAIHATQAPRADAGKAGQIGLGWHISGSGTLWHNGQTGGYHSYVALRPSKERGGGDGDGVGVVVLAAAATPLVDVVGKSLLDILRGRDVKPLDVPPLARLGTSALDRCVGTYTFDPSTRLTVRRDGARLFARFTGQEPLRVFPETPSVFHYRALAATLVFDLPTSGPARSVVLRQGGQESRGDRGDR